MQIDDDATRLIWLLFDTDPAASYLARIDLYLAVLPAGDRMQFIESEIMNLLQKTADARAADVDIMRGLVARRRVLLKDLRAKLRVLA